MKKKNVQKLAAAAALLLILCLLTGALAEGAEPFPAEAPAGSVEGEQPEAPAGDESEEPEEPAGGEGEQPEAPAGGEGEQPEAPTGEGEQPEAPAGDEGEQPEDPTGDEGEQPEEPAAGEGEQPEEPVGDENEESEEPFEGESEEPLPEELPAERGYTLKVPSFTDLTYLAERSAIGSLRFTDVTGFLPGDRVMLTISALPFVNSRGCEIFYTLVLTFADGSELRIPAGESREIACPFEGGSILLMGGASAEACIEIGADAWNSAEGGSYSASLRFDAVIEAAKGAEA